MSNRAKEPGWGNDAFVSHRNAMTEPFSSPVLLAGVANPNSWASDPNPTPDNLDLFFEGGCTDVFHNQPTLCGAHRNTADGAFGKPFIIEVGVGGGSTPKFGGGVYTVHAGAIAYFVGENVNGHQRLARAQRIAAGDFGVIEEVVVEGVPEFPYSPVVSEDETELFFETASTTSMWVATRQDTSKPFTNLHVVAELPSDAYANWISPDGCRLYFSRELDTDAGSQLDVFVASR